jgi:hypothetical protein
MNSSNDTTPPTSDRDISEDYRQQKQAVAARDNGFESGAQDRLHEWIDSHEADILAIAERSGAPGDDPRKLVEEYKQNILSAPVAGPFDDGNASFLIGRIVQEIEAACHARKIPIREGVAFGVSPEFGLRASQMPVLTTDASIITVSLPFLPFCNLVSKVLASSLPLSTEGVLCEVSYSPTEVLQRIKAERALVYQWVRIVGDYAMYGWPPAYEIVTVATQYLPVRHMILEAMELFAISHEYGHHVLRHLSETTTLEPTNEFSNEHQADLFARAVSMMVGSEKETPNFFSISGAGGIILLSALELVRRARGVLLHGAEQPPIATTHPPLDERIACIGLLDENAPKDSRRALADMRSNFIGIFDLLWEEVKPVFVSLHKQGLRPEADRVDTGGWLPLFI